MNKMHAQKKKKIHHYYCLWISHIAFYGLNIVILNVNVVIMEGLIANMFGLKLVHFIWETKHCIYLLECQWTTNYKMFQMKAYAAL